MSNRKTRPREKYRALYLQHRADVTQLLWIASFGWRCLLLWLPLWLPRLNTFLLLLLLLLSQCLCLRLEQMGVHAAARHPSINTRVTHAGGLHQHLHVLPLLCRLQLRLHLLNVRQLLLLLLLLRQLLLLLQQELLILFLLPRAHCGLLLFVR